MFICNKGTTAALALIFTAGLHAQTAPLDPSSSIKIDLPPDSPLNLISTTMGDSRATSRGGAIVLDLHMGLTLRNSGARHIRGVTLLITAQEFAPGGKGSVARLPSTCRRARTSRCRSISGSSVRCGRRRGLWCGCSWMGCCSTNLSFYGPNKRIRSVR